MATADVNEKSQKKKLLDELGRIQRSWGLSLQQMAALVHVSPESYSDWQVTAQDQTVGAETPESQALASAESLKSIHDLLSRKFPKKQDQIRWLYAENKDFGGSRPIDVAMSSLDNLYWVSYYLTAQKIAAAATNTPIIN